MQHFPIEEPLQLSQLLAPAPTLSLQDIAKQFAPLPVPPSPVEPPPPSTRALLDAGTGDRIRLEDAVQGQFVQVVGMPDEAQNGTFVVCRAADNSGRVRLSSPNSREAQKVLRAVERRERRAITKHFDTLMTRLGQQKC